MASLWSTSTGGDGVRRFGGDDDYDGRLWIRYGMGKCDVADGGRAAMRSLIFDFCDDWCGDGWRRRTGTLMARTGAPS